MAMSLEELLSMPTVKGRHGCHISAILRIDAMQLRDHGIRWAATTMEQAAAHIDALEKLLMEAEEPKEEKES